MTKNSVADWDTTAANNTDVGGIDINEGCPAANINNALRETMAQVKTYSATVPALSSANTFSGANTFTGINTFTKLQKWAKGADVASASTLTLGDDGNYFDITGTTAITAIATKGAGTVVKLHFDASLTLTHNATDLILPGGANITTAAGDEAEFVEYATGDWRCTSYQRANSLQNASSFLSGASGFLNQTSGATAFAALEASFTAANPGQVTLPNGFRMKWGVHSGGDGTVTFSSAFLSAGYVVITVPIVVPGSTSLVATSVASLTTSGFAIYKRQQGGATTSTVSVDVYWLAIGQ